MKTFLVPPALAVLFVASLLAEKATAGQPLKAASEDGTGSAARSIEVCFVLDTTGSMSGLIEGAKNKIWAIANDIVSAKPKPQVSFGLVAYRDRGDEYVTKTVPLTNDMDAIYKELKQFSANGGGDEPESVGEALHEAVHRMQWASGHHAFKVIYLVGDAPPQTYADGKRWQDACAAAADQEILINTIQCGNIAGTAEAWKAIASRAGGVYAVIPQDGNIRLIAAPQDKELQELNAKIGDTLIPWGSAEVRSSVGQKQKASEAANPSVNSSRLAYNSNTEKSVQGGGELIDALKEGKAKLEDVKPEDLPESLRGLSRDDLKAHVARQQAERKLLQKRIAELVAERDAYLEAERKKQSASGKIDSFDEQVAKTLHEQARTKGMLFDK